MDHAKVNDQIANMAEIVQTLVAGMKGNPQLVALWAAEKGLRQAGQRACKPGSVPARAGDGHSSGTAVASRL